MTQAFTPDFFAFMTFILKIALPYFALVLGAFALTKMSDRKMDRKVAALSGATFRAMYPERFTNEGGR